MNHQKSATLFAELTYIPGGVNSPVRAFKSVGCDPFSSGGQRVPDH